MVRIRVGSARSSLLFSLAFGVAVASLALPAVQRARAEAAKVSCEDNLKKMGRALLAYEQTHGELPAGGPNAAGSRRGWAIAVLPELGEEALARKYRLDRDWFDPANREVVSTALPVFQCPVGPNPRSASGTEGEVRWTAATSDYVAHDTLDSSVVSGMGVPRDFPRRGLFSDNRGTRLSDVSDGAASTLMVSESAGRPEQWVRGKKKGSMPAAEYGAWASRQHKIQTHGHSADGTIYPGPCGINCTNWRGLYSFHPQTLHSCFADGSVRTLTEGMNVYVLYALVTIRGGEVISPSSDY